MKIKQKEQLLKIWKCVIGENGNIYNSPMVTNKILILCKGYRKYIDCEINDGFCNIIAWSHILNLRDYDTMIINRLQLKLVDKYRGND